MKIIALGSPGVGKGTYAKLIVEKYGIITISSGDLFRENIKNETELGKKAKELIDAGHLVPDEITIEMMKERLSREDTQKGFVLDGFPRTIPQAEALAEFVEVDMAINFKADKEIIMQRLTGRRTCKKCAATFHMVNLPPQVEGVCDKCEGELIQRSDELPEVIEERLKVYEEQTAPLIDYYKEKGLLRELTINEDMGKYKDQIMEKVFTAIDNN
ncbi:adenylate kinase [Candidatus Woesearchaeota archaeon]|jgi:adenylate kinase|nr:adenylate kinase [Candidatus Woesearchaeota archaeon]MBT4111018.1 adenylate kinase [Candidatus Woesearchaeota archaeon]MBT4336887.1 adenylate kinase [Candidatus Woesearchaeota archaeon]MBT4469798.1 adenylate kinase [Candidatus Woesearchaeota archaeon]MBT6743731.1 adenylate kinase [Candidatus Woesearchaeota archaeon]